MVDEPDEGDGGAAEDPVVPRDATGGQESVMVERRGEFAAVCKWSIFNFAKVKARALWSKYFEELLPFVCEKGDFDFAFELCKEVITRRFIIGTATMQLVVDGLVKESKMEDYCNCFSVLV
ncbi:hypothetical protein F0562_010678 [Nyssa sinensis]|uniref:Uncharacterized protein n=1 Tax=Nyssa sinensis TaxID=561372 RepID=A0A5J4ZZK4_9ASTE|nr:hypothetical protein F0562_010678 [Nyssa sinensis]